MIVEMREYTLAPGKVPEYFKLYEAEGMTIQREILGRNLGYYSTEIGPSINMVVHLWAYDSFDDRVARRRQLGAHPGWQSYVQKIRPMILAQANRILTPAPFMEARRRDERAPGSRRDRHRAAPGHRPPHRRQAPRRGRHAWSSPTSRRLPEVAESLGGLAARGRRVRSGGVRARWPKRPLTPTAASTSSSTTPGSTPRWFPRPSSSYRSRSGSACSTSTCSACTWPPVRWRPTCAPPSYGRIINMASGTPFKGVPLLLHYVASKGAVIAMTRALAKELGGDNILVNTVAPGFTMSDGVMANAVRSSSCRRSRPRRACWCATSTRRTSSARWRSSPARARRSSPDSRSSSTAAPTSTSGCARRHLAHAFACGRSDQR